MNPTTRISWCSFCHTVYADSSPTCLSCKYRLLDLSGPELSQKGQWRVFCSRDGKTSVPQMVQILGRSDSCSDFLFNAFISKQHARLVAGPGYITLEALDGRNGTFIQNNAATVPGKINLVAGDWQRLLPEQQARLHSGDWFLLSKECLCQCWLQWVPLQAAPEKIGERRRADAAIELPMPGHCDISGIARIFCNNGQHFIKSLVSEGDPYQVLVNRNLVVVLPLHKGDRVNIDGQEYEYTRTKLLPAFPLSPPRIVITDLQIADRLQLEKLEIAAGSFVGIIGASGSGKSTLIKVLTGWLTEYHGQLTIDSGNRPATPNQLHYQAVYLPQYDIVYGNLSVNNCLWYAGLLRTGDRRNIDRLRQQIGSILTQVDLFGHRRRTIARLSGGQRKRVNIAQELLLERAALFILDEPTSGLDLINAHNIMQLLRRLCHHGRTVVCATHNIANIDFFDKVAVLRHQRLSTIDTPKQIAAGDDIPFEKSGSKWRKLYQTTEQHTPGQHGYDCLALPWSLSWLRSHWWILLIRLLEDMFSSRSSRRECWMNRLLQPMLVVIPLAIGISIAVAWPHANGDEKRFFLCSVAAFWLGMSIASTELRGDRFRIFLHEKKAGVNAWSFFVAYLACYATLSLIQTTLVVLPNLWLVPAGLVDPTSTVLFQALAVFWGLALAMGICGIITGLVLALWESFAPRGVRWPVAVTVPFLTIVQMLFSEMVMGLAVSSPSYFFLPLARLRDYCYLVTFSRYIDMAYHAYYNNQRLHSEFWWNILVFAGWALVFPAFLLLISLRIAKPRE